MAVVWSNPEYCIYFLLIYLLYANIYLYICDMHIYIFIYFLKYLKKSQFSSSLCFKKKKWWWWWWWCLYVFLIISELYFDLFLLLVFFLVFPNFTPEQFCNQSKRRLSNQLRMKTVDNFQQTHPCFCLHKNWKNRKWLWEKQVLNCVVLVCLLPGKSLK